MLIFDFHDFSAVDAYCRQTFINPHRLQRLRNKLYKQQQDIACGLEQLSLDEAERLSATCRFDQIELIERHDSQLDGASKLVFRTAANMLLESVVLRICSGRTALCISSQVGCAAKCSFCATGQMGMAHNLTYSEIVEQVIQANRLLRREGRKVRNVVFMGMGEPFHNEDNVVRAVELLCSPHAFNLSPKHVSVSTVGIPDAMVRFARRFPQVSLALSLHSARQDARMRIIPLARRYPLDELRLAMEEVIKLQGRKVMIEYLLLADVNDSDEDAAALIDYLSGLQVHINLIPYNPIGGASNLQATDAARRWDFARRLRAAGYKVTMRHSLGSDIAAACGQLVREKVPRARPLVAGSPVQ